MTAPKLAHSTEQGRFYEHPSKRKEVPSITNIKDMKSVDGLKYWAANQCATYASERIESLAKLQADDIYQLVKRAPWSKEGKKATSSKIGDIVHEWIDQVVKGAAVSDIDTSYYLDWEGEQQPAPIQAKWTWSQYAGKGDSFLNVMKPDFVMSEFTVWSDTHDYAGTMDWAARVGGKRLLTLGDNKTGKKVYPDMAIQLAAGAFADYILLPDATDPSGYKEIPVPEFDAFAILHLRPRSWSLVPLKNVDAAFKAFVGLRAAFEWKVNFEDNTVGNAPRYEVKSESVSRRK